MGRKLPEWLSVQTSDLPPDMTTIKICPKCGSVGHVQDSRVTRAGTIMRRRICPKCKWLWKTVEFRADDPLIRNKEEV